MNEISEKAIKLIKDLRRDISIDIMFTPEKNAEDDSLKALVDYIAELEAAQRWIPVGERLPEEDTDGNTLLAICRHSGEWVRAPFGAEFADEFVRHYTHWMPLPKLPEVQESEATSCKFCGSNKSDRRMNSIVCTSCGRKIGNIAQPEVQE